MKVLTLPPRIQRITLGLAQPLTTSHQRLRGRGLQKRNASFLRAHPLCRACEATGRVTAAAEVDHIIPLHLGGPDHESNLQGLCVPCHESKTAGEARERVAPSAHDPKHIGRPEGSQAMHINGAQK